MTGAFYKHSQDSTNTHREALGLASKPNRRTRGQRRIQPDRRKANLHVTNCRRRNAQDRRVQGDRRPSFTEETEILGTVPVKKQFFVGGNTTKIGTIINISV